MWRNDICAAFLWLFKFQDFNLKVNNPDKPVANGLEVLAVVSYTATEDIERKDRLVVTVDGEVIEVPIIAYDSP